MSSQQNEIREIFKAGCFTRQSNLAPHLPFSAATMWRRAKEGTFPRPQKLSANCTAWANDELNLWFSEQAKLFNGGKK
jgi:prophage regulatory protein